MNQPWTLGHRRFAPQPFYGGSGDPILDLNPVLWLDASDASSFTLRNVDGVDYVEEWRDKSGNGNHAVQESLATQPTLDAISSSVFFPIGKRMLLPNTLTFDNQHPFTLFFNLESYSVTDFAVFYDSRENGSRQGVVLTGDDGGLQFGIDYSQNVSKLRVLIDSVSIQDGEKKIAATSNGVSSSSDARVYQKSTELGSSLGNNLIPFSAPGLQQPYMGYSPYITSQPFRVKEILFFKFELTPQQLATL